MHLSTVLKHMQNLAGSLLILLSLVAVIGCGIEDCSPITMPTTTSMRRIEKGSYFDEKAKSSVLALNVGFLAMTFNLLYESGLEPLANLTRTKHIPTWTERKENIIKLLRNYQPQLLALQESTPWQASCLQRQLPQYAFIYGEGLADSMLAYKRQDFTEISRGSIKLPYPSGSIALIPRGASWANLQEKITGKKIFACAAHLDNRNAGYQARALNASIIPMAKKADIAMLMGDFNTDAQKPSFKENILVSYWQDSLAHASYIRNRGERLQPTFALSKRRIDHILMQGDVETVYWEVTKLPGSDELISDHFPVTVKFNLRLPITQENKPWEDF